MKRTLISCAVATALFGSVSSVWAVDLDDPVSSPAAVIAKEISLEAGGLIGGTGVTDSGNLDVSVDLGFGFSATTTNIYVRFDIASDHAAFGEGTATGTAGTLSVSVDGGTSIGPSSADSSNNKWAVFSIAVPVGGLPSTSSVDLDLSTTGIEVTAKQPVEIRYRLYNDSFQAATGGTNALKDKTGKILEFDNAVELTATSFTNVPSVGKEFLEFKLAGTSGVTSPATPEVATPTKTTIGQFSYGLKAGVLNKSANTPASGLAEFLGSATAIQINGTDDVFASTFSTANGAADYGAVFISPSNTCATVLPTTPSATTTTIESNTVTFKNQTTIYADHYICYIANSETAIPSATFTIGLVPAAVAPYSATASDYSGVNLGIFNRDGTTLQATFTSGLASAAANRFTFSNTGSTPAPITGITLYLANEQEPTLVDLAALTSALGLTALEVPAKGVLNINRSFLPAGGKAMSFTIGAESSNIKGIYQLAPSGDSPQMILQMVSPPGAH